MVRYSLSGRTVFCHALAGVDGYAVHSYVYAPVLCDETTVYALDKIVNRCAHVWKFTFLHRDLDAPSSLIDATCPFSPDLGTHGRGFIHRHGHLGHEWFSPPVQNHIECSTRARESLSSHQCNVCILYHHIYSYSPRHRRIVMNDTRALRSVSKLTSAS
jgi:hypothetical protein